MRWSSLVPIILLLLGYAGWLSIQTVIFASAHNEWRTFLNFNAFGEGFTEAALFSLIAGVLAYAAGYLTGRL